MCSIYFVDLPFAFSLEVHGGCACADCRATLPIISGVLQLRALDVESSNQVDVLIRIQDACLARCTCTSRVAEHFII